MIYVNIDVTDLVKSSNFLNGFISNTAASAQGSIPDSVKPQERFSTSLEDLITSIICDVILDSDVTPARMTSDEKLKIVTLLNEKAVFLLKGAVVEVASHLLTSEATVHRHLILIQRKFCFFKTLIRLK